MEGNVVGMWSSLVEGVCWGGDANAVISIAAFALIDGWMNGGTSSYLPDLGHSY